MIKAGTSTGVARDSQWPNWISDLENQRKWNSQFLKILMRDYANSDVAIAAILKEERLSQLCATKIRSYVDKEVTLWLTEQRKARGAKHKKQLDVAIAGLRAAVGLSMNRGNQELARHLGMLAEEFSRERGRCKEAYATKRHGRDRAHSLLSECRAFLESKLGHSVTNATLANLVNVGYEADGNPPKEPITEEHIRKNLAHFKRNNPFWRNKIDPHFQQLLADQATK